jgi:glycine hydroxymethyltransferase
MNLSHGGHLTHGSGVNFSGSFFRARFYGVKRKQQTIDYDQVEDLCRKHKPKLIIAGASAYPRVIDFQKFRDIAQRVEAYLMADMAHIAGLVAADLHPTPVGVADFVTSTTHKTLRGPRGGLILSQEQYGQALDKGVFPGIQGGPLMHVIAAKAVAFGEALTPAFKDYQRQIIKNAKALADALARFDFDLVSGGTDNHLVLIDLTARGMSGADAESALGRAGIVANKNVIPFDKKGPKVTSGLRLGTPALTTRGMRETEMAVIADLVQQVLSNGGREKIVQDVRAVVAELCQKFPVYDSPAPGGPNDQER